MVLGWRSLGEHFGRGIERLCKLQVSCTNSSAYLDLYSIAVSIEVTSTMIDISNVNFQKNGIQIFPFYIPTPDIFIHPSPKTSKSNPQTKLIDLIILINRPNLLRTRTPLIKPIPQPLLHQPPRELEPNNPLSKTQHLRIITQHRPLHTKAIMSRHGTDPSDLVRGDGDA